MNLEEIITILQKSAAGADDALETGMALGEGDTARANTHIYRAAKLALADIGANLTAIERVVLLTTIDETEPHCADSRMTDILIYFSEDEYATVAVRAGEQGMTSSTYLRWAALYATL